MSPPKLKCITTALIISSFIPVLFSSPTVAGYTSSLPFAFDSDKLGFIVWDLDRVIISRSYIWASLLPTFREVRTAFADNITSKFKELPASTEDNETEWCLFRTALLRPLLTVAVVSVLERQRVARKELLAETKKLKKLFVRKK